MKKLACKDISIITICIITEQLLEFPGNLFFLWTTRSCYYYLLYKLTVTTYVIPQIQLDGDKMTDKINC